MFKNTLLAALTLAATIAPAGAQTHPLDPLTEKEYNTIVRVLKDGGKLTATTMFPIVSLKEPSKSEVRNFRGGPIKRAGFAVILDRSNSRVYEATVDVSEGKLIDWKAVQDVQPGVLVDEFDAPKSWVRNDPDWQAAMRKRGISDFENVHIDTWAPGLLSDEDRSTGKRFLRCIAFYRVKGSKNPYFRPIEGVIALVDMEEKKVRRVEDTGVIAPVVKGKGSELDQETIKKDLGRLRPVTNQIQCHQPEGGGFTRKGNHVVWENWSFRFSMHPREGLVLHDLNYNDAGRQRPVLYRGSLSEMVVPYGDPAPNWYFRNAFDLGEYGVGRLANTLRLGADVPDYATLLDATFADDHGKPYVLPKCVAIYERDNGLLWKHQDFDTQTTETRRARWLHLSYIATIGNYDYALTWKLGQDGSISVDAQLTGIVLAKGVASPQSISIDAQGDERFGRLVGAHTVAPNHQHFFNFRLDLDVDGSDNSVVETNNEALPEGPDNPVGNAFSRRVTWLKTEKQAARDLDLASQRTWMVISPQKNALNQNTAYMLVPGENSVPYLRPSAPVRKRAGFIDHHVWFTQFKDHELNAAGFYPNQSQSSSGIPGWVNDDESLDNKDCVMWYTFGVTHNPRPEEWPVMPAHHTGFKLLPNGFFSRNPALDVQGPPTQRAGQDNSHEHHDHHNHHQPSRPKTTSKGGSK